MESLVWNLFRYRLALKHPLMMLGRVIDFRQGLILQFKNEYGMSGEGEIAPLEGIHLESLEQAEEQILSMLKKEKSYSQIYPSVFFGLEMAWNLFNSNYQHHFPKSLYSSSLLAINALIMRDETDLVEIAEKILNRGFQAVKLKVGDKSIEKDLKRVHVLKKCLGPSIPLRLDANRAWNLEQACEFAEGIGSLGIDYCEEPLKNKDQLKDLAEITSLPLALDETLWEFNDQTIIPWHEIKALILKPGRLGGWKACQDWLKLADQHQLKVIFSSCLESGLGLTWIAMMNLKIDAQLYPAGLDTFEYFQQDLAVPALTIQNGFFSLPDQRLHFDNHFTDLIASGRLHKGFFESEMKTSLWDSFG